MRFFACLFLLRVVAEAADSLVCREVPDYRLETCFMFSSLLNCLYLDNGQCSMQTVNSVLSRPRSSKPHPSLRRKKCIINPGRFPFNQKFRKFRNGDKRYGNFLGKFPENPEIVEFPKSEPFNRKFRKFWEENQMERKFAVSIFRKFGFLFARLSSFPEIPENAILFNTGYFRKFKPAEFEFQTGV